MELGKGNMEVCWYFDDASTLNNDTVLMVEVSDFLYAFFEILGIASFGTLASSPMLSPERPC